MRYDENANNLNPDLASKPDYIPSNLQDLCVDYTAFKAMVLDKATKYENLWKESLTLDPFDGNITEEGDNFVIKLNMTATQNTVIVFYDTKKTGTLTASPQVVTAFTNLNGTGNSTISWSTANSPRTLITLTRTLVDGTEVGETFVSIKNNNPTGSATRTISEGLIHTFKLYTGEIDSDVLGDLLDTVIVYGGDVSLSVNEIESQDTEAVSVFPNPVENVLNVKTSKDILAIEIYNIIGQKLKKVTVDGSNKATIDVSALQQNLYVLQITTLDGVLSKRFAKK